jgi:hypothetical protein
MRMYGTVTVDDVLQALVGRTGRIESSAGLQLATAQQNAARDEQGRRVGGGPRRGRSVGARPKASIAPDPWAAMDRAEQAIGREMGVLRCLDDLARVKHVSTRWLSAFLSLAQRAPGRTQGELVILCLRAFHEWATQSKERALAEVYAWSHRVTCSGDVVNAEALALDFRAGRAANARKQAARLYSDALEVLAQFVRVWNRKASDAWHRTGSDHDL